MFALVRENAVKSPNRQDTEYIFDLGYIILRIFSFLQYKTLFSAF